jgi:glycosyltransferase involved in cell wall biosynthesis
MIHSESTMAEIKLTIISAVRNDLPGLLRTLASVAQELPEAEHLIIDGSDSALLTELQRDGVKIVFGRDRGISHAFNKGILDATGDYVMFLNAGDHLTSNAGASIRAALEGGSVECIWFSVFRVWSGGQRTVYSPRLHLLKYAMAAPHQGMIIKRVVFAEIGLFPLQRYSMDHHLALRLMVRRPHYSVDCKPEPIADYPSGGHSTQGGFRPFLYNCWNTLRITPRHFPLAVLANLYLALKSKLA